MWSQALKNKLLEYLNGKLFHFACPVLVAGACRSGATFHLDIPCEIFHSPAEHICILFRLFIASL